MLCSQCAIQPIARPRAMRHPFSGNALGASVAPRRRAFGHVGNVKDSSCGGVHDRRTKRQFAKCSRTGWPWSVAAPGSVGGGGAPRPNPKPDVQVSRHPAFQMFLNGLQRSCPCGTPDTRSGGSSGRWPAASWRSSERVRCDRPRNCRRSLGRRTFCNGNRHGRGPVPWCPYGLGVHFPRVESRLPNRGLRDSSLCLADMDLEREDERPSSLPGLALAYNFRRCRWRR